MLLSLILIIPLATALICALVPSHRVMTALGQLSAFANLALAVLIMRRVLRDNVASEWHEFLWADALSAWMLLLISVVAFGSSLYAGRYFRRDLADGVLTRGRVREFYALTPLFIAGMSLVVLANNIGVMWFAVEATALTSVLLVALYNRRTSLEAAWKYIILGSLALALALMGTVFLYASAIGPTASERMPSFNWSHFQTIATKLDPRLVRLAFVLALVGYGTKAGLAPMHTWLPDAHSEAPSPTSAMLSGVSLKIAVYALLRFHILASSALGSGFSCRLLLALGLFSMFLAPPFILVQRNLKRMLAYSSLEHVGLICVGMALNTPVTIFGALLHMGYHALTKPVLFFAAGNIHQVFHSLEFRVIGAGVAKVLPGTVLLMALAAIAAVGLPPFGMFLSEMTIIGGGLKAGYFTVSILILIALIASFCGILQQLTRILLGPRSSGGPLRVDGIDGLPAMSVMLAVLLLFSLWLPGSLLELMRRAAAVIGGTA